jgi:hypothetical protein
MDESGSFRARDAQFAGENLSHQEIRHRLGLNKNLVLGIVKRDRAA